MEYKVEVTAPEGKGVGWLAETVIGGVDCRLEKGQISRAEIEEMRFSFSVLENGEQLDLTESEQAALLAVLESRTGRRYRID